MTRPKLISAKDPDIDTYWLTEGTTLIRKSDGAPGVVVRTMELEAPRSMVRLSEDFEGAG
jgi:hypothetical protein